MFIYMQNIDKVIHLYNLFKKSMCKYWWKLKNILPVLVYYKKYLETTGLSHYPNNRKMLRGKVTSQLFTFVEVSPLILWTQS